MLRPALATQLLPGQPGLHGKDLCRSKDREKETDLVKRSTFQKPTMSSDQGHMHWDTNIKVQGTRGNKYSLERVVEIREHAWK